MTDRLPLPEPAYGFYGAVMFSADQVHEYSDATLAAERITAAHWQSLAEANLKVADMLTKKDAALRERVKVLEDRLRMALSIIGPPEDDITKAIRAALEDEMKTLPERLRDRYMDSKNMLPCALEHEAAAEIYRLRDALARIERVMGPEVPNCSGCVYEWNEALGIARAALEEK